MIKINYNEDEYSEIELDKNKRFIKGFKNVNLDIMLIEIIKSDNIKDKYFLSFDIEEKNYYQKLVNKDIYILHFPQGGELCKSKGEIIKVEDYLFSYTASTNQGSSGAPIILAISNKIIGIHKEGDTQEKIKYGHFIFPIIQYLQNDQSLINKIKQSLSIVQSQNNDNDNNEKAIKELYSFESSICKIIYKEKILGIGFFCEISNEEIPFKKSLFTNNQILDQQFLKTNKEIIIEYLGKKDKIKITPNRKVFTDKKLNYSCIEILDSDIYNNFLKIDSTIFN